MPTATPGWQRWLPGLQTLRTYRAEWLRYDLVAGVVLSTMLVPVGIAYAEASGVPGIYGLYATVIPLLTYALFGPSRILVLGPDSSLAALILAVVLPLAAGNVSHAVAVASLLAVVSGVVCISAGVLRLGFITELLSKPIRYGYMNGIALTVLISQLPKIFGVSIDSHGPLRTVWHLAEAMLAGKTNWSTFAIGAGALAIILSLKRFRRIPVTLLVVVAATILVGGLDLGASAGVQVLGAMPQGLPHFVVPRINPAELGAIVIGGIEIALVSFADTSILSRTYAAKTHSYVDPNQEMVGLGAATLAAGLFQGFPISSSASRTPVAEASGVQDAAYGRGRCRNGRRAPHIRAASAAEFAQQCVGRNRDRLGVGTVRIRRSAPHFPDPALGVLAVDRLPGRRCGARRGARHRPGHCDCRHRIPMGRLAAILHRAGPGRWRPRLP